MSYGVYWAEYVRMIRENHRKKIVERLMEFKEVLLVDPKTFVEWFREELEEIGYEEAMNYFLPEDYNRIAEEMRWPKLEIQR